MAHSLTVWISNSFLSSIAVIPGTRYVLKVPTETCTPLLGRCASTEKARRARRQTAAAELAMVLSSLLFQTIQAAIYCQRECKRKPNTTKVTVANVIVIRYAISGIARLLYVNIVKWNAKDNTRATVATDTTIRYDISGMHGFLAYTVSFFT